MLRGMRHRLVGGALAILALSPAAAGATGGQSIASAPTIPWGQQQFGNLANGDVTANSCGDSIYTEWWLLSVASGDHVKIDWEAQEIDYTELDVYPRGTTDFNYPQADATAKSTLNSNAKAELALTATSTGNMPVAVTSSTWSCLAGTPGPYDFTAYVRHALVLAVPRRASLSRRGVLRVAVHNPDGGPVSDPGLRVSLQLLSRSMRRWRTVGSATAAGGRAAISYAAPRSMYSRRVSMRVVASGAAYVTNVAGGQRVRVR